MAIQHERVLDLIREALAEQGCPLREHEFQRMQRFLEQLDLAQFEGPGRVAQVVAAFSEPDQELIYSMGGTRS